MWLRYALISFACFLVAMISVIIYKYRRLLRRRETELGKEDVLAKLFLRKLRKVQDTVGSEDPAKVLKNINRTMRSFFSELFDIRYQFDYVELNEELTKLGIEKGIKQDIISYTIHMSKAEYGKGSVTDQDIQPLLEKSIDVVSKITGHKHEVVGGEIKKVPEPPEKKAGAEKLEEAEHKLEVPHDDKGKLDRVRSLLVEAEHDIQAGKLETVMQNYSTMKDIYESLSPAVKMRSLDETKRIIDVYNALLIEFKGALVGEE